MIHTVLLGLVLFSCATPGPQVTEPEQGNNTDTTSVSPVSKPPVSEPVTDTIVDTKKSAVPVKSIQETESKAPVILDKTDVKQESKKDFLQEVEEAYAKAQTLKADFEQIKEIASLGTKKSSRGVIKLRLPGSFRWETTDPDKNIMVTDGRTFWFYTPPFDEEENGQVIVKKNSEAHTQLASTLLAGKFSSDNDFKIKKIEKGEYQLIPNKGTAGDVRRARISIDTKTKIIERVVLEHKGGNRTEISLKNVMLGEKASESEFKFKIPPRTDVIKE